MTNVNFPTDLAASRLVDCLGSGRYLGLGKRASEFLEPLLLNEIDVHVVTEPSENSTSTEPSTREISSFYCKLPFQDNNFNKCFSFGGLDHLDTEQIKKTLTEIKRVTQDAVYLTVQINDERNRDFWEKLAFSVGFRRHSRLLFELPYESLNFESDEIILIFEVVPISAEEWTLERLVEERDLHMDMSRETGSRSDAHLVRYRHAVDLVRPGDRVLDAACGLGYGSWMIATSTQAESVTGYDASKFATDYADANFGTLSKIKFITGNLPEDLAEIPDGSFDIIVSFETVEHIREAEYLVKEFFRLLTPGGRLIVSVPNDWSDETGADPNPYHFDVYNWQKLKALMGRNFLLDSAAVQTADRAKVNNVWVGQKRSWARFDPSVTDLNIPAEWIILIGIKAIDEQDWKPWLRPWQGRLNAKTAAPVDFNSMLNNPWLERSLLDRGQRYQNPNHLQDLCSRLIEGGDALDTAAALAVSGYGKLESPSATKLDLSQVCQDVERWLTQSNVLATAHHIRWTISLSFLRARLAQRLGLLSEAEFWYERCITLDASSFGPTAYTKITEACHRLGWLRHSRSEFVGAQLAWAQGVNEAAVVLGLDTAKYFNAESLSLPFLFDEYSLIFETANLCAIALDSSQNDPGNMIRHSQVRFRSREALRQTRSLNRYLEQKVEIVESEHQTYVSSDWAVIRTSNFNEWCGVHKLSKTTVVLHPLGFRLEDQPQLIAQLPLNARSAFAYILVEASNSSTANRGAMIFYGSDEAEFAHLKSCILEPCKPKIIAIDIAELQAHGSSRIKLTVAPLPNANSFEALGVELQWVGESE